MAITLASDRLSLSEVTPDDVDFIHFMNSHVEVAKYNTTGIPEATENTSKLLSTYFEDQKKSERTKYAWLITLIESGDPVGEIGLTLSSRKYRKGEIFYSLDPARWGIGLASEATKRIIQFCFEELKLHRMEAGVATENHRSIALLERVGFSREGHHRLILPTMDGWKDNYSYGMLEDDYFKAE